MKTLFLDIDGVLNKHDAKSMYDDNALRPELIALINYVIENTQCKIFVISNWAQQLTVERLSVMLYSKGLKLNSISGAIQSKEILCEGMLVIGIVKDQFVADYIKENNITSYAVVDDDMKTEILDLSKLVRPNRSIGITKIEADKLINILNN